MSYRGHIKDGTIVLDPPARLPEGTEVRIEIIPGESRKGIGSHLLQKWRGRGRLPTGMSVDDYLSQVRDDHSGR